MSQQSNSRIQSKVVSGKRLCSPVMIRDGKFQHEVPRKKRQISSPAESTKLKKSLGSWIGIPINISEAILTKRQGHSFITILKVIIVRFNELFEVRDNRGSRKMSCAVFSWKSPTSLMIPSQKILFMTYDGT